MAVCADTLDRALLDFAGGAGDVLLATNIVEAGLDIPRANAMLVWHADRFGWHGCTSFAAGSGAAGCAGWCGCSPTPTANQPPPPCAGCARWRRSTAPAPALPSPPATSTCAALATCWARMQAGHLRLIGLELYQRLLSRALRTAEGRPLAADWTPNVALGIPSHLPPDYVPDEALRIALHIRLARLEEPGALAEELEDRFGPPPSEVVSLLVLTRLRRACRRLGVARLEGGPAESPRRSATSRPTWKVWSGTTTGCCCAGPAAPSLSG